MTAPRFTVTYRVTPDDARSIEAHAMDICIEETVEIPYDAIPKGHWEAGIVGNMDSIEPVLGTANTYDVRISYRCDVAGNAIPNLVNVLFGNISIRRGIKITNVEFAKEQIAAFGGPKFGIEGIRKTLGVHDRPLATTAIKPLGLSSKELAAMCGAYARGGLDAIKDDHGLINQNFHPFEERIKRIQGAIDEANAKTGRKTLYFPMIAAPFAEIESQFAFAKAQGCYGVLIAPLLIGLDTGFHLAKKYGLAVMCHPTFAGTHFHDPQHGMTPAVLLGQLFRLWGADVSVYPNYGGRFTFTRQECFDLADACRNEWHGLKGCFPSPAGGMTIDRVGDMVQAYGRDTALLIGGALLKYNSDGEVSARAFVTALEAAMRTAP
jgi:ribulose-bisphosphate carboxylase large chain